MRSPEAEVYHRWYSTARWQAIRRGQLQKEPLCCFCLKRGDVVEATVCDHIDPHRGDEAKFWFGPFISLCKQCHDSEKKVWEARGYSDTIGADGWPTDVRHPVNAHRG